MDTINQIQALDSKRCSHDLIEMRLLILDPVQEWECGRLRLKNQWLNGEQKNACLL